MQDKPESLELKGLMLKIYLYMLKLRRPMSIDENPFSDKRHEVKYYLEKMEGMGLVLRNPQGEYVIVEEKMLDTVLKHVLNINIRTLQRYAFYSAFFFTSLIFFVVYTLFLPQTDFTTKIFAITTSLFSIIMLIFEILKNYNHKNLLNYLLT